MDRQIPTSVTDRPLPKAVRQFVESTGSSSSSSSPYTWSEAKKLVLVPGKDLQSQEVRFWASRKRATNFILKIHDELFDDLKKAPKARPGDYGVCRHRYLRLGINPAEFARKSEKIAFGALYTVEEVSPTGGWLKINVHNGLSGWIESKSHFAISAGEFKILSPMKRNTTLNFLINSLAACAF